MFLLRAKKKCNLEQRKGVITPIGHVSDQINHQISVLWLLMTYCTGIHFCLAGRLFNIKSQISIFFGKTNGVHVFQLLHYFLSPSNIQVIVGIRNRDSILLALGVSLHKSTQPSKIRECSHECVFCFCGVFFSSPPYPL